MDKSDIMPRHVAITTSPVTSSPSLHLPSGHLTDEEEPNEMVIMFIDWDPAAVNRFLEKWHNAIFATPPPFERPNNARELQRGLLEYLTQNILGASITSNISVDCNSPALALLTGAMAHLEKEQWVRTIIDAQPGAWNRTLGGINIGHGGRTLPLRLRDNHLFD